MNKEISNMVNTPPPVAYEPMQSFKNTLSNKQYSIGLPIKSKVKSSPGPGQYSLSPIIGNEGLKFSLKKKANDHSMCDDKLRSCLFKAQNT